MRILYVIVLALLIVVSVSFILNIRKEKGLSSHLRRASVSAIAGMISCIVTALSQSHTLSVVFYGVYFTSLMWLMVFFTEFVIDFTGLKLKKARIPLSVIGALTTVNCVMNVFGEKAFTVKETVWAVDGGTYLVLETFLPVRLQLGLAYFLAFCCVISLIVMALETPRYYRPRYLILLFMVLLVVAANVSFIYFSMPMDWSILFYSIFIIVLWYFATRYIQTYLLTKTLSEIVGAMDTGLVVFDYQDNCIYLNSRANMMLQVDLPRITDLLEKWYQTRKASDLKAGKRNVSFIREGSRITYEVIFQDIRDREGAYNGGYFALRDVTDEERRKEEEYYDSTHDRLTNLYSFDAFVDECEKKLKENPDTRYVMIQTETEAFETIRDVYGSDMRNAVIGGMGSVIKKKCGTTGVGGRMSGDSFGVLLPEEIFSEKSMIEEIQDMMTEILGENAKSFRLRAGVCPAGERGESVRTLMDRARGALSYLREDDPAYVSWFTDGMLKQAMVNSQLSEALPDALKNNELKMYLQAQIDGNDRVIGAEALVRWHREGKVLMPGSFLPLFEKNEQIAQVDRYIWEQAFQALAGWKKAGRTDLFIAVNVARKDLYLMDICEVLGDLVKKYGIDPKNLHVDFSSETLFLEGARLAETVEKLKKAGFVAGLDEFGGKFTSPVLLKSVSFDGIKISRQLICGIETDNTAKLLTKGLIETAGSLSAVVMAEGIETERELKSLKAMNCNVFQGFFISEPIPVPEFEQSFL